MLPHWATLIVWGLAAASFSTLIYRKLAPQDRIEAIKGESNLARAQMLAYDGDFEGLLTLVRRTLRLSLTHLGLSLGPAVGASVPALLIFLYLDRTAELLPAGGRMDSWEVWFFASAAIFSILLRLALRTRAQINDA